MRLFLLLLTLCLPLPSFASGSILNVVGTSKKAYRLVELHQAIITNPQTLIMLAMDIRLYFSQGPEKFRDLDNDQAHKLGILDLAGSSGLSSIVLSSGPYGNHPFGSFTVEVRELTKSNCIGLLVYTRDFFHSITINGSESMASSCKDQWFFQKGKNTIIFSGH